MKRKGLTVIWTSSWQTKSFVFFVSRFVFFAFLVTLLLSWVMVAVGTYVGIGLYRNYLQVAKENSSLVQKKQELDALALSMNRVRRDAELIRNVLGLEKRLPLTANLGRGGMPTTDLSSIASKGAIASSDIPSIPELESPSILDEAKYLQTSIQEMVDTIREKRELLASTPSIVPVDTANYWFSSGFGWRRSPFTGLKEFHEGVDISAPRGTPIIAPGKGKVIKTAYHRYRGKYLQLDHGMGRITTYAHLSRFNVTRGDKVERGQVIAYMGSTGRSTGSHLHYEIENKGKVVNPMHYILNVRANRVLARSYPGRE
ncbi:MAG: M23 family metallopeptidase [Deltaproteobacteria bacterium]|nr:MAG: M23 family metallopeptidase [Deltaproteobacteria bacterium]